jgi:hypothetical protein
MHRIVIHRVAICSLEVLLHYTGRKERQSGRNDAESGHFDPQPGRFCAYLEENFQLK